MSWPKGDHFKARKIQSLIPHFTKHFVIFLLMELRFWLQHLALHSLNRPKTAERIAKDFSLILKILFMITIHHILTLCKSNSFFISFILAGIGKILSISFKFFMLLILIFLLKHRKSRKI